MRNTVLNKADTRWINSTPQNWRSIKIKHIANKFTDGDWIESPYITTSGVRLIQTGNIGVGVFKEQGFRYISEKTFHDLKCTEVHPNDLLICRLADPVGRACLAPRLKEKTITSVDVCILQPKTDYDPAYLVYFLSSKAYLEYLGSLSRGGTRDRISRSMLGNIEIVAPSLEMQKRIAKYLDEKLTVINQAISQKQRLLDLLKEKRAALIHKAVTRGLDKNVKLVNSGVEWIGKIPEGWILRKVKQAFKIIGSGTTPMSSNVSYYENGNVNWVITGDLNDGILTKTSKLITQSGLNSSTTLRIYPENTLLIAMYGATIGKIALLGIPAATNQACCAIGNSDLFDIDFVFFWFLAQRRNIVDLFAYGSGQPNISQNTITSLRIPCPPKQTQNKIIKFLRAESEKIDKTASQIERSTHLLKEYRTSLISHAVTGRLDL